MSTTSSTIFGFFSSFFSLLPLCLFLLLSDTLRLAFIKSQDRPSILDEVNAGASKNRDSEDSDDSKDSEEDSDEDESDDEKKKKSKKSNGKGKDYSKKTDAEKMEDLEAEYDSDKEDKNLSAECMYLTFSFYFPYISLYLPLFFHFILSLPLLTQ